ncbi:MAG: 5'/3'-nucleotidase SurE [Bryobacteraceae bacterium]
MAKLRLLVTNDDGWDAPGLAALADVARRFGEVVIVAPRDPHSYAGHRVTTDRPLELRATAGGAWWLDGSPADCVRVALRGLALDVDWVLAGINRGGNLGADLFTSGTVAAAREAALLGKPAIAISQYVRRDLALDWSQSAALAESAIERLVHAREPGIYFNVNLPHRADGEEVGHAECEPDNQPLDVRFACEGAQWRYAGSYAGRPRTPGRDVDLCFGGAVTVSRLRI